jgi:hypothetical protein
MFSLPQVFCEDCSSKTCTIPQYDINKPVRVCDECFVGEISLVVSFPLGCALSYARVLDLFLEWFKAYNLIIGNDFFIL